MNKLFDIHERIFRFVTRGLKVIPFLPRTIEAKIIIDQYARSLTSVGANDNEADGTSTKNDFLHVCTIVRKELKETRYWLRIIAELYPQLAPRLADLIQESEELIKIISKIIINTKAK
ncbi:MAG: four helix bundle protein [Candidatus Gottesmanbacteria bacterium]|nr:four helix bundle protein [Candidatus Gottesmanbacteria bacterium]